MKLTAQRRWCLTGTPISNRVEDLGSLIAFCRVPQLEDSRCYQLHVTKAANKSFAQGCKVLKEVLLPICLRRTKAILNIPQPRQVQRTVMFASDEREQYDKLLQQIRRTFDDSASGRTPKKALMLQAILRLRIFCDQGTFTSSTNIAAERHFDPDEALALLQQADEARCARCRSEVVILGQPESPSSAVLGSCSHLICASCYDDIPIEDLYEPDAFLCPVCHVKVLRQQFIGHVGPSHESQGNSIKRSSKLDAVVADLIETQYREKRYGHPASKPSDDSFVFSLCLIQEI